MVIPLKIYQYWSWKTKTGFLPPPSWQRGSGGVGVGLIGVVRQIWSSLKGEPELYSWRLKTSSNCWTDLKPGWLTGSDCCALAAQGAIVCIHACRRIRAFSLSRAGTKVASGSCGKGIPSLGGGLGRKQPLPCEQQALSSCSALCLGGAQLLVQAWWAPAALPPWGAGANLSCAVVKEIPQPVLGSLWSK